MASANAYDDSLSTEIQAEADLRRNQDPEIALLELEFERAWADLAPTEAGTGFQDGRLLDQAAKLAILDPQVPIGSRRFLQGAKWIVRKLTYWYVRFITDQFNVFAGMLMRHLRGLEARLGRLEAASGIAASQAVLTGRGLLDLPPEPSPAVADQVEQLTGSGPSLTVSGRDSDSSPLAVLEDAKDGSLDTIVLAGVVENLPLGTLVGVVQKATAKLNHTGQVIVAVADPASRSRVEAELGPGLGLSPAAWRHLLERAGYETRLEPCADSRIQELVVAQRPTPGPNNPVPNNPGPGNPDRKQP